MKVLVFSERLAPPPDEGIKKLALALASAARALGHEVLTLTSGGATWPEADVINVESGRLLASRELTGRVAAFSPRAILYVPTASLTLASGIRCRMLRRHGRGAPAALIATQGRRHRLAVQLAARLVRPDRCVVQSAATERQARRLGWPALRLAPGIDRDLFRPLDAEGRLRLRERYAIPSDAYVVLHVGHLNAQRGVAALAELADLAYPLAVVSTSTRQDAALAGSLQRQGVHLITRYIPNIAELYQLSDVYLFPTPPNPVDPSGIDLPLSVLEALACNLPVLATRFGALPELWPAEPGVSFYDDMPGLRAGLAELRGRRIDTRSLTAPFDWRTSVRQILEALVPA